MLQRTFLEMKDSLNKCQTSIAAKPISYGLVSVVFAGLIVQLMMLMLHTNKGVLHTDELSFMNNTRLLMAVGYGKEFFTNLQGQAFGPLLNFVHYITFPITNLEAPQVRMVHFVLAIILYLCFAVLIHQRQIANSFFLSFTFAAIPMMWQISGGVWSMVPSLIAATLGITFLFLALSRACLWNAIVTSLIGGIFFGLAILGRTTFLAIIPILPLLLIKASHRKKDSILLLVFASIAICISLPMLMAWGGVLPPSHQHVGTGYAPWHLVLNFSYGFFIALFSNFRFLKLDLKSLKFLLLLVVIFTLVNFFITRFSYSPLLGTFQQILPNWGLELLSYAFPGVAVGFALYFATTIIRHIISYRHDRQMVFLLVCSLVMFSTSIKIVHLYSSVYSLQALPFLILPLSINRKIISLDLFICSIGILIGLNSYNKWLSLIKLEL